MTAKTENAIARFTDDSSILATGVDMVTLNAFLAYRDVNSYTFTSASLNDDRFFRIEQYEVL